MNPKKLNHSFLSCFGALMAVLVFSCPAFLISGCSKEQTYSFHGKTMGTTWNVSIVSNSEKPVVNIGEDIQQKLDEINGRMSLFNPESEVSLINSARNLKPMSVSGDLLKIFAMADDLYQATGGKWDCTIGPLTELWGFGKKQNQGKLPGQEEIALCLESTGYSKLTIDYDKKTIAKTKKDLMIDFGSIAKGFAVDEIRLLLLSRGLIDFIVEIGGEVYASGRRKGGGHWRVGINRPWKKAAREDIFKVVEISNKAVASSGDYRNFFEQKGKTYSHIIDPVTGWPVSGYVTAVTVIADNTAMADGLATALMLLGCDQGLALIESLDNTDALIITRKGDALESCKSSGWHY